MSLSYSPAARSSTTPGVGGSSYSPLRHHQQAGNEQPMVTIAGTQLYRRDESSTAMRHLFVLPVLLLEFLAIALTRAVLPSLLLQKYKDRVYIVMGAADCIRGLLAFVACPVFGRVSDVVGRKICLFVTVLGTCAPICSLAFFSWDDGVESSDENNIIPMSSAEASESASTSKEASDEAGIFSSTFTLVFAYISDTVKQQDDRVSAYGLALATFGLSFTIGPMAGGYLAQYNKQYVFVTSLILTMVDLVYIYLFLPESRDLQNDKRSVASGAASLITMDHNFSWNPLDTIRLITVDPFLRLVGKVALLYYTGLWALISTLSVYAVKRFHLGPERLGELMSALGLCTMIAEAVLVRLIVPAVGEKRSIKIGLISFALQCFVLGFAYEGWHLFACAVFSLLGNLVYPALSSLVSGSVEPDAVGEALGAINGIKALTEGIGPLVFGSLMTLSGKSALPGWPYLLAGVLVIAGYKAADELPDADEDDYIHELERKNRRYPRSSKKDESGIMMRSFGGNSASRDDDEYQGLLSEIDESDDEPSIINA